MSIASSSALMRSHFISARNVLLQQQAPCTCATLKAVNFKGKNRAYFHGSTSKAQQQEQAATTSTTTPLQQEAIDVVLDSSAEASGLDSIPQSESSAEAFLGGSSATSPEMLEVYERRRRLLLSKLQYLRGYSNLFQLLTAQYLLSLLHSSVNELESIGSSQTRQNTWQPHHSFTRPKKPSSVTLSNLLAATAHLGHSKSLNNPMAFSHIYGTRNGISVIDVRETLTALRRAASLVRSTVENDGIILFVGNKNMKDSERVLEANAKKMGKNGYATSRWLPGTLTNASKLFSASKSMITEEGVDPTSFKPDIIVLFSPLTSPHTLREANAMNVPTIALCDSNVDPRHFTYPIPCNDDSLRVVELISGVLAEAGREGIKRREFKQKRFESETNQLEQQYQQQQRSLYSAKQRRLR